MDKETVATYDRAAQAYAEKFAGIGPRVSDIEQALVAFGRENPRVLELGCGDGRDAVEILKRTSQYHGIDISKKMINLAKEKAPEGRFAVADLDAFSFTVPIDIIFAFASLLHVNKETFEKILKDAYGTLSPGGIFKISLKEGEYRGPEVVKDDHGENYYEESDIRTMAEQYEILLLEKKLKGHTNWLEVMLQKV